jgi:hypothetical protein
MFVLYISMLASLLLLQCHQQPTGAPLGFCYIVACASSSAWPVLLTFLSRWHSVTHFCFLSVFAGT